MQRTLVFGLMALVVPAAAGAGSWEAEVGGGLFVSGRTNTDTEIVGNPFYGGYAEGYGATEIGALRIAVDGRFEQIDDEGLNDVYESGPVHTGVIGLHAGTYFNDLLVGVYAGSGYFDGYDFRVRHDRLDRRTGGRVQGGQWVCFRADRICGSHRGSR